MTRRRTDGWTRAGNAITATLIYSIIAEATPSKCRHASLDPNHTPTLGRRCDSTTFCWRKIRRDSRLRLTQSLKYKSMFSSSLFPFFFLHFFKTFLRHRRCVRKSESYTEKNNFAVAAKMSLLLYI